ncbi:MAG: ISAs1 family transposase [Chloroflexota bacterium]
MYYQSVTESAPFKSADYVFPTPKERFIIKSSCAKDKGQRIKIVGNFFKGCQAQTEQLAMDGQTLRGTIEAGHTRGVHWLAVYAVEAGVVLNQVNVLAKENEISAAPKVLADVELRDKVVTGDAMFTQRNLSSQIIEAGGAYL